MYYLHNVTFRGKKKSSKDYSLWTVAVQGLTNIEKKRHRPHGEVHSVGEREASWLVICLHKAKAAPLEVLPICLHPP